LLPPVQLHFPSFPDPAGLSLDGTATVDSGQIVLATQDLQAGSVWATTKIDPARSFVTSFELTMTGNPDGMAFVIRSASAQPLGSSGAGLGYGSSPPGGPTSIAPSLDVEFDTFDNSAVGFDPPGHQHIAVMNNGDITQHLFWADPGFSMFGNGPVFAWMVYDAAAHTLTIYASQSDSRPASPLYTASVNLTAIVGTAGAFVGLTGGTGPLTATETVQRWDFSNP
jgi:hypothetical protein